MRAPRYPGTSRDGQADPFEAANHGISADVGSLEDHASFDEHRFQQAGDRDRRVNRVVTVKWGKLAP
ncbi:hypothetical protein [Arthrobacter sp. PsM3]|uniref:hypothetical protein n=1 Tax=Arthrobacter sp. PsM3 TaxID=3030531 RepID=UPI00263BA4DA|nr:hypothetical protein [Arthrobacter sp. PsM3]MDN4645538.1 hypothetical protein [Arthrobacter sp. PsM3]